MQDADREPNETSTPAHPDSVGDVFKKDQSQGPNQPRDNGGQPKPAPGQSSASDWDRDKSKPSK